MNPAPPVAGGVESLQVVDGQQRLTVIQLLLIALRMHSLKLESKTLADLIQKQIYFTNNIGRRVGLHLRPSPKIINLFDLMADENWSGSFPEKIDVNGQLKTLKREIRKIKPVYDFFQRTLTKEVGTIEKTRSLFNKLINETYFSVIFVSDESEAFKIFERTNSRGMALEASDLIKNFLFQDGGVQIRKNWEDMESEINSSMNIGRLSRSFFTSAYGHVLKKDLFRELKRRVIEGRISPLSLSSNMLVYAKYWRAAQGSVADWRSFLNSRRRGFNHYGYDFVADSFGSMAALRSFGFIQHYPLVFRAIESLPDSESRGGIKVEYERCARLIRALENFHFISNVICGNPTNQVEHFFAGNCITAGNPSFEEWSEDFIKNLLGLLPSEATFVEAWQDQARYEDGKRNSVVLYTLDRLSNFGKLPAARQDIFNSGEKYGKFSVEHFLSQHEAQVTGIDPEIYHSIGNLLPVPNVLNAVLGAKSPQEKVALAGPRGPHHSNLQSGLAADLFRDLGSHFSWGPREIEARTESLALRAYRDVWAL